MAFGLTLQLLLHGLPDQAVDLAALMPDARALDIPGRDHNLAVGDRTHKEGVLAFLAEQD